MGSGSWRYWPLGVALTKFLFKLNVGIAFWCICEDLRNRVWFLVVVVLLNVRQSKSAAMLGSKMEHCPMWLQPPPVA